MEVVMRSPSVYEECNALFSTMSMSDNSRLMPIKKHRQIQQQAATKRRSTSALAPVHPKDLLDDLSFELELDLEADLEIRQLRQQNVVLTKQLEQRSADNALMKDQMEQLKQQTTVQQNKLAESVKLLTVLLVKDCDEERKRLRARVAANRVRLGQFVPVPKSGCFADQWQDGEAFGDITRQFEVNAAERDETERLRKALSRQRAAAKSSNKSRQDGADSQQGTPGRTGSSTIDVHEQDEVYKMRLLELRKDESDLQIQLQSLERQRNTHIAELRRIQNEDISAYNKHPLMNGRYLLLNLLGKGGFSEVYRCFDVREMRYAACKMHQLSTDWPAERKSNYMRHAIRERDIQRHLCHPRIVQLYDVFEIDSSAFCTVLEYCDGCDLDFYLKQRKMLPEKQARCIILQTVTALRYLNEIKPPIIHYDLKPGNILLNAAGDVKISDFGLSKVMDDGCGNSGLELTSQFAGTYWYLPPECFVVSSQPPKISSKVDVWSLGVIFYQCLFGRKPFGHNLTQTDILVDKTILSATEVQFPLKPTVSVEAKDFIRLCLKYDKDQRPDVLRLAQHEYLKTK